MPLSSPRFADEVRRVFGAVRAAYLGLLAELGAPAAPIERAVDLQRALDLDKKLAWRVHRLAHTADPLQASSFVPPGTSAERIARAARKRGASAGVVDELLRATAAFEEVVRAHAQDRPTFDALAAELGGGEPGQQVQLDARRAAFRANRVLHGRFSDLLVYTFLVAPGADDDVLDAVSLRAQVGLQRLRPSAAVELARHRFESERKPVREREPLDEVGARAGAPLLPEFCSDELPTLLTHDDVQGFRRTMLATADVGARSRLTFTLGERTRALPFAGEAIGSLCELATPARRLVHDLIVHESVPVDAPGLRVVAGRGATEAWPAPDAPDVLPGPAAPVALGAADGSIGLAEWPDYERLLSRTFTRLGWDPARFRVHRAALEYPVLHSIVWLRAPRAT